MKYEETPLCANSGKTKWDKNGSSKWEKDDSRSARQKALHVVQKYATVC